MTNSLKFVALMEDTEGIYAVGPFDDCDAASEWADANETETTTARDIVPLVSRRTFKARP